MFVQELCIGSQISSRLFMQQKMRQRGVALCGNKITSKTKIGRSVLAEEGIGIITTISISQKKKNNSIQIKYKRATIKYYIIEIALFIFF